MKEKFITYYMDVAERTSLLSYAVRLQVGAIIVKDNRILSYGYNGMPAGWDNNCENKIYFDYVASGCLSPTEIEKEYPIVETIENETIRYRLKTKPEVLHAESNCIAKVAGSTESCNHATMFCTHAPCIECAKLIYQAGIKNLYFKNMYRETHGLEFLEKSGVHVHRYPTSS
jgi:dCMP deaminase